MVFVVVGIVILGVGLLCGSVVQVVLGLAALCIGTGEVLDDTEGGPR